MRTAARGSGKVEPEPCTSTTATSDDRRRTTAAREDVKRETAREGRKQHEHLH